MNTFVPSCPAPDQEEIIQSPTVKLLKRYRVRLRAVLGLLERGQARLMGNDILVCQPVRQATTTLHFSNSHGEHCVSVSKDIGSELALLHTGIAGLRELLAIPPKRSLSSNDDIVNTELPARERLYAILKKHYKHERFEARNDPNWCQYSQVVTDSCMEELRTRGYTCIDHHSSVSGDTVYFDSSLTIIEHDCTSAMTRLSQRDRRRLLDILNHLKRGQRYLYEKAVLLCEVIERVSDPRHFTNPQGQCCARMNKRDSSCPLLDEGIVHLRNLLSDDSSVV